MWKEHLHWQSVNGEIGESRNGAAIMAIAKLLMKLSLIPQVQAPEGRSHSGACTCVLLSLALANECDTHSRKLLTPFLVSFYSVDDYLSSLDEEHRIRYRPLVEALNASQLPPVISAAALAVLFGYSPL